MLRSIELACNTVEYEASPQKDDFEFDTTVDWLVAPLLMTREMHPDLRGGRGV